MACVLSESSNFVHDPSDLDGTIYQKTMSDNIKMFVYCRSHAEDVEEERNPTEPIDRDYGDGNSAVVRLLE